MSESILISNGNNIGKLLKRDGKYQGFVKYKTEYEMVWHHGYVVLDCLNIHLFTSDDMKKLIIRFDLYSLCQSIKELDNGEIFLYQEKSILSLSPELIKVYFMVGDIENIKMWIDLFKQIYLMPTWSISRFTLVERVFCCCMCGSNDVVFVLKQTLFWNIFFLNIDLLSDIYDTFNETVIQWNTLISLVNNIICLLALWYIFKMILSKNITMQRFLSKSMKVSKIMSFLYFIQLIVHFTLYIYSLDHNDHETKTIRQHLQDLQIAEFMNLLMWFNCIYCITWVKKILKYEFKCNEYASYYNIRTLDDNQ